MNHAKGNVGSEDGDDYNSDVDNNTKNECETHQDIKISCKKISKHLPGLETRKDIIDSEKIKRYVDYTVMHKDRSLNIWKFMFLFILSTLNFISFFYRTDLSTEYSIRKMVETFCVMNAIHPDINYQENKKKTRWSG